MIYLPKISRPSNLNILELLADSDISDDLRSRLLKKNSFGYYVHLKKLIIIISLITWVEMIQCRSREKHCYLVNLNTRNLEKATGC